MLSSLPQALDASANSVPTETAKEGRSFVLTPEAFSPDGEMLAFSVVRSTSQECGPGDYTDLTELHVLDLRSGSDRRLDAAQRFGEIVFSVDGQSLAYVTNDDYEDSSVRTIKLPAGEPRTLARGNPEFLDSVDLESTRTHLLIALSGTVTAHELSRRNSERLGTVPPPQYSEPVAAVAGYSTNGSSVAFASAFDPQTIFIARLGGPGR